MSGTTDKSWEALYYERKLTLLTEMDSLYTFLSEETEGEELYEFLELSKRVAMGEVEPPVLRYKLEEIIDLEAERFADGEEDEEPSTGATS